MRTPVFILPSLPLLKKEEIELDKNGGLLRVSSSRIDHETEMAMLPANFQLEGSILPVRVPPHFERFYRETVRRVAGSRIRSVDLRRAYLAWADARGAPSMSFAEIRRAIEAVGHRRVQSNGVHYADLIMAVDVPDLSDTLPALPSGVAGATPKAVATDIVAKVDAVLASLLDLRRAVMADAERANPAQAAQRVLGLFDQ